MTANPMAMIMLATFAQQAKSCGRERIGIALLIERVRWFHEVEAPGRRFKIPNAHRAYIARALMDIHPELVGMFATSELTSSRAEPS